MAFQVRSRSGPMPGLAGKTKRGRGGKRGTGVRFKEKRAADMHHSVSFGHGGGKKKLRHTREPRRLGARDRFGIGGWVS